MLGCQPNPPTMHAEAIANTPRKVMHIDLTTAKSHTHAHRQPSVTEISLLRVGRLLLLCLPGEPTTMAGRRLARAVKEVVEPAWGPGVRVRTIVGPGQLCLSGSGSGLCVHGMLRRKWWKLKGMAEAGKAGADGDRTNFFMDQRRLQKLWNTHVAGGHRRAHRHLQLIHHHL